MERTTQSEDGQDPQVESQQDPSNTESSTTKFRLWAVVSPETLAVLALIFAGIVCLDFLTVTQGGIHSRYIILIDTKKFLMELIGPAVGAFVFRDEIVEKMTS
jgi:hypothetical protein